MKHKKMILPVITEIPKNSNMKYEYDAKSKRLVLDRILYGSNLYPENYGFIENTLDYDGDPLDVVIICNYPILPMTQVNTRILGVMYMIDDNEEDSKLIGVVDDDPDFFGILDFKDLKNKYEWRLTKISDFFSHYKNLEQKEVQIDGFGDESKALEILNKTKELFKKQKV